MSNSFEEEQSVKSSKKEEKEPVSDEKVFDRFAGNIAESDDDYDEEDDTSPRKKSSGIINENPQPEAKSSFFTQTPVIANPR